MVMATPGTYEVGFSSLTAGTTYYAHYVAVDLGSTESNVASSLGFTTDAALAPLASKKNKWSKFNSNNGDNAAQRWRSPGKSPAVLMINVVPLAIAITTQ